MKRILAIGSVFACWSSAFLIGAASAGGVSYTYDSAGRLVRALYDKDGVIVHQYDKSGNRTRKTVIGPGNPDADYDGNTLADLWEYIYFGFTGNIATNDSDDDGFTDGQEAVCWTDPTNAQSFLQLTGAEAVFDASNSWVVIQWPSYSYASYGLWEATNLLEVTPFTPLVTNIPATPPMNVYTASVSGAGPFFYRISAH